MKILVILASYNGAKYIEEQIDSILNQESVFVHIMVFDDCSKDNTIEVLNKYNLNVEKGDVKKMHKIVSEYFHFPDRTSKDFYAIFNKELLYGMGIISTPEMLEDIYKACSYLEWEKFDDTKYLTKIECDKFILSNFNKELNTILDRLFSGVFQSTIISEIEGLRKPDTLWPLAPVSFAPYHCIVYLQGNERRPLFHRFVVADLQSLFFQYLCSCPRYRYHVFGLQCP